MGYVQVAHAGRDGSGIAGEAFDGLDLRAKDGSRAVIFAEVGEGELLGFSRSDQPPHFHNDRDLDSFCWRREHESAKVAESVRARQGVLTMISIFGCLHYTLTASPRAPLSWNRSGQGRSGKVRELDDGVVGCRVRENLRKRKRRM